jgi:predicted membrane chloride channel (bestrophin family)
MWRTRSDIGSVLELVVDDDTASRFVSSVLTSDSLRNDLLGLEIAITLALSFLLVFRLNRVAVRFGDCRALWGGLAGYICQEFCLTRCCCYS